MPETRKPSPEDIDPSSNSLLNLIKKYGMKEVPFDELSKIGYTRRPDGNIVKISALEKEKQEREQMRAEGKDMTMEEKIENKPFGLIPVEFETVEIQPRHDPRLLIKTIRDLRKEHGKHESFESLLPEDHPLRNFRSEVKSFISKSRFLEEDALQELDSNFFHWLRVVWDDDEISGSLGEAGLGDTDYILTEWETVESIKQALNDLDREKARVTDLQELKRDFFDFDSGNSLKDWPELIYNQTIDYCKTNNITNIEEFKIHLFRLLMQDKGFGKLGEEMKSIKTYGELGSRLSAFKPEEFPYYSKLGEINKKIKQTQTKEKKIALSGEKKIAEQEKQQQIRLIEGLAQYVTQYELVRRYYEKAFTKIVESIVRVKKGGSNTVVYYLDATPDPEYDNDPGRISGDCTEGKPLPFADPNTPVYNVKVLNEEKRHVGNIYLLETRTSGSQEEKVWHLEAIQIPGLIDWKKSLPYFVEKIAAEALKKDVKHLTVNFEKELISNYDYIQDAVFEYTGGKSPETSFIKLPEVKSVRCSDFQGTGEVRSLWHNDRKS